MRGAYFDKFIIFLMILLITFALFLQFSTVKSTEKLKAEEIKNAEHYASKIAKLIESRTVHNIERSLTQSLELREHLNETLQAFLTKQYKYIFVLQKDLKGNYRFLLDGSKEETEVYKSIFFPKSELFNKVYETQKMQIVKQSEGVEQIWLSLVYPIVNKGTTEALLVLDLSESYAEHLSNFNSPLMSVVWMMQIFLGVSLLLLIYLGYRYHKVRKGLIIDTLTSVYKKKYLYEFFNNHQLDEYHAILIDMDEFKKINKKHGYEFGDRVIIEFTQTLLDILSDESKIIRVGGTEFLTIIPKENTDIETLANTMFKHLKEKKYLIENEIISITVSMSAMSIPEKSTSIQNIQRLLDEKLLKIKSKGKNNVCVLGVDHLDEVKYSDIDYIKEALEEERLLCLYQPIFNTQTKEIIKYEALVRLQDKNNPKKFISPYHFMDVLKGTSQYIKMSKLVLSHVFSTLQKYPDIELSVNVDLDDLDNDDMMKLITENLYHHSEIADRLTFEILEDNEVTDYKKVQFIFQQLKAFGSKVALDDFGSGYTNYIYLVSLDIDILKIDGSLVRELKTSPERTKLVLKSIQELAKKLNVKVVAEFISDESIYHMVRDLEIEYVQGYYLGEPKLIDEYRT